jgi:hypothetical protein
MKYISFWRSRERLPRISLPAAVFRRKISFSKSDAVISDIIVEPLEEYRVCAIDGKAVRAHFCQPAPYHDRLRVDLRHPFYNFSCSFLSSFPRNSLPLRVRHVNLVEHCSPGLHFAQIALDLLVISIDNNTSEFCNP